MFSKTCEYAIRATVFVAHRSDDVTKLNFQEIAHGIDAPTAFVAKILQKLVKAGIIQSLKGKSGGFYMDANCLNKTVADIVKAIDGDKLFAGCAMGLPRCSELRPVAWHEWYL